MKKATCSGIKGMIAINHYEHSIRSQSNNTADVPPCDPIAVYKNMTAEEKRGAIRRLQEETINEIICLNKILEVLRKESGKMQQLPKR